ncbi:MAG: PTS IIA-like nitrogen regulatory protein PtsN [Hyphomicrobiaceae bacterium]
MDLGDIVELEGILPDLRARSKKQVLQELSDHAGEFVGVPAREIFDTLLQRERLGSTGLGRGIAIPHIKLANLDRIVCLFARLHEPVDFDAIDGEPVDLVFVLLAPEHASGDHLKALSRISRLIRAPSRLDELRAARTADQILAILTSMGTTSHAA